MTTKKKRVRYVSPPGVAIWPRLNEPDTKFKAEGEFTAKLAYDQDEQATKDFVAKMEALRDSEFQKFISENPKKKKAKLAPVFREEVDDEGDETGRVTFNFKMKHKVTAKKDQKVYTMRPTILNAKKDILKNPPNIGGGSVLRVSFEVFPYFNEKDKEFGLSFRMIAVQIITLVEFGGASRAADDFDEEEGDDIADGEGSSSDDDGSDDDSDDSDDDGDGDF